MVDDQSVSGFNFTFKFCIVGGPDVGKSCIRLKTFDDIFVDDYVDTVGPEYSEKVQESPLTKKIIKVTLWDGPGSSQRSNETKKNTIIRGCQGAFIVFDITNRESFEQIKEHVSDVRRRTTNAIILLLGNKADLPQRQVNEEEGATAARRLGCKLYLETSAKTGDGLTEAIDCLVQLCQNEYRLMETADNQDRLQAQRSFNVPNPWCQPAYVSMVESAHQQRRLLGRWYPPQGDRRHQLELFLARMTEDIGGENVLVYPADGVGAPVPSVLFFEGGRSRPLRLCWRPLAQWRMRGDVPCSISVVDIAEVRPPPYPLPYALQKLGVSHLGEGRDCIVTVTASERCLTIGALTAAQAAGLALGLKLVVESQVSSEDKRLRGKADWSQAKLMAVRDLPLTVSMSDLSGLGEQLGALHRDLKLGIDVSVPGVDGTQGTAVLWLSDSFTASKGTCDSFGRCEAWKAQPMLLLSSRHSKELATDADVVFEAESSGFSWTSVTKLICGGRDMEGYARLALEDISEVRPEAAVTTVASAPAICIVGSERTLCCMLRTKEERNRLATLLQHLIVTLRPTLTFY